MINIESISIKFKNREVKAKDIFDIREISKELSYDFIRQYHYLGDAKFFSMYNYGLFIKGTNELVGCATYSLPQGTEALKGWFGLEANDVSVMELTRLCLYPALNGTNATSYLLSHSIKMLKNHNVRAVITLADASRHVGSIYQVCNFKYYGLAKVAKDFYRDDGAVNPRGKTGSMFGVYLPRTRKHRYAYILDKTLKCLYNEEKRPTLDNTHSTVCCEDNFVVYDNRYDKWYTCPKCCSHMIELSKEQVNVVKNSSNKKETVEKLIKEIAPKEQLMEEVSLF
jgi:hypothetical protein